MAMTSWFPKLLAFTVLSMVVVILLFYNQGNNVKYVVLYTRRIFTVVATDQQRKNDNHELLTKMEWDYHKIQKQFMKQICKNKRKFAKHSYTWLTASVNDAYVPPAIVLGYSIRTLSCVRNMTILVADKVSHSARNALAKVGWNVKVVEQLDCRQMEKNLGKKILGGSIIGTYTRFHAWNYTQFSKIIYTDPDYMLFSNIDELFEEPADFSATYCSRPGIIDPCFNAGLLVFKPDFQQYQSIMKFWEKISIEEGCPSDQQLLLYYFSFREKWNPLSYAYNVRRNIYQPMKGFHFVCCPPFKPWTQTCRPSRNEAISFDEPITDLKKITILYWKNFYEALAAYKLDDWWKGTEFYYPKLEFGKVPFEDCWKE